MLSRVGWPPFPWGEVWEAVGAAHQAGKIFRACLQVTDTPGSLRVVSHIAQELKEYVPLSASLVCESLGEVEELLGQGLGRICLSLDGVTPEVYRSTKGGIWGQAVGLLEETARRFPGRIATHLMVGLGESEAQMVRLLEEVHSWGIIAGLFAFTPVRGTALEGHPPPKLGSYRRVQMAHFLIRKGFVRLEDFSFSPEGRIAGYGLEGELLEEIVADGEVFQTSGCPGCNRPYYNERPGGVMYNYPRPLSQAEVVRALAEAGVSKLNEK